MAMPPPAFGTGQVFGIINAQTAMLKSWADVYPSQFGVPPHRTQQQIEAMGHNLARTHAPERTVKVKKAQSGGKPKRPLNSFIAFRSYYADIFRKNEQRNISTIMNRLWHYDPFKAKWTIVAKAYTMLRDKSDRAPPSLRKVLELVCPKIGIIGVDDYLDALNWMWAIDNNGDATLVQNQQSSFAGFDEHTMTTRMTEEDILYYLIEEKLLPPDFMTNKSDGPSMQHLMASTPAQIRKAFLEKVSIDPKAVAAEILGIEENSPFLEISSGVYDTTQSATHSMGNNLSIATLSIPNVSQQPQYQWTGNMSELYQPNEPVINLDSMANIEWNNTDIGNPLTLDGSLESVGYDPTFLATNVQPDQTLSYNFWDSF